MTLNVVHWYEAQAGDALDVAFRKFEAANPGVTIETEHVPFGQYFQKVGAYLAVGDGPDVMMGQGGLSHLEWAQSLLPLDAEVADVKSDVVGWQSDVNYGVPLGLQAHLLAYRNDVLLEAGLDPAQPPQTWREMADACAAILELEKHCIVTGFSDIPQVVGVALVQLTASEDHYVDGFRWTDPPIADSLRLYEDMINRGWLDQSLIDLDRTGAYETFIRGDAAFLVSFLQSPLEDYQNLTNILGEDNFGLTPFPAPEPDFPIPGLSISSEATKLNAGVGHLWVVPSWSTNPAQAIALAKFFTDKDIQFELATTGAIFPASTLIDGSQIPSPHYQNLVEHLRQVQQSPFWALRPSVYVPGQIAQAQLMLLGEVNADDAAREIDSLAP